MKDWMFFEERQRAKEIISKMNLREKIAFMEELNKNLKNSSEYFVEDIEKKEWNKMLKIKELKERNEIHERRK